MTASEPDLLDVRLDVIILRKFAFEMFGPHLFPGMRMWVVGVRVRVRVLRFLVRARHFTWLGSELVDVRWRLLEVIHAELDTVLIERNSVAEVTDCGVGGCEREVAREEPD